MPELPPAGWYDDGTGAPTRRWWDGARWTDRYEAPQTPSSPDPEPVPHPASIGGRHGAAAAAAATASTATAGVAAAHSGPDASFARRERRETRAVREPEVLPQQGLAQAGAVWRAGGASAAVITRDPLPDAAFAPPAPASAAETSQWVEGLEVVKLHNPQALLGVVVGVISIIAAPFVAVILPALSAGVPSLTGLAAVALGVAGVVRGRWSGAGRGLAIAAILLGITGLAFTAALRSGALPELLPPLGLPTLFGT